jgi:hypothetical protein
VGVCHERREGDLEAEGDDTDSEGDTEAEGDNQEAEGENQEAEGGHQEAEGGHQEEEGDNQEAEGGLEAVVTAGVIKKMDSDMIDSMTNYNEEEQKSIMRTLTAVQKKGWSHGNDPFQFYIILGSVIREKEKEVKDLEESLQCQMDQTNKKEHCISKFKDDLKNEKDINVELEEEQERIDGEAKNLQSCLKNKDEIIIRLDAVNKEQMDEIENSKENCERLAKTKIILEKKMKIANEVIKELNEKLSIAETLEAPSSEEIVHLMLEIEHLQNDISEKEKLINDVDNENAFLSEELKKARDTPIKVLDDLQIEETVSLGEELGNDYVAKSFECKFCSKMFETRNKLKLHKRKMNSKALAMKLRLYELGQQISDQKLDISLKISSLKEKEFIEKQTCQCRGWCAINHQKHGWKIIKSEVLIKIIEISNLNFLKV